MLEYHTNLLAGLYSQTCVVSKVRSITLLLHLLHTIPTLQGNINEML